MNKWIGISLGTLLGISHIGMIGFVANSNKNGLPSLDIPVGDYTSYQAEVNKEGYRISYKSNDPKTMYITKDIKKKGGFLGLANNTEKVVEEYVMDGSTNQGGAVSNHRSWLDSKTQTLEGDINSSKSEACIKAIGGAEGTGRLVGTSVGAAAAPAVSSIPFVGWVAAGWIAMFGGNQGAEIGGNMAEELNKNC
tara:strand:+ start:462 stop:1043 length:582 start_codon:yes stop_codon:yes gene_type:complete